ncbi:MAG: cysteine desulfurase family protein [Christensenellales bacterium]|jgi:cysteine desulfurase
MIYLDNAATTKQDEKSFAVMKHFAIDSFFNASSVYAIENSNMLEKAREEVKKALGGSFSSTVVFTSGATEANNLVLNSFKDEIIVSAAEHESVYQYFKNFSETKKIKICPMQTNGELDYEELKKLLTPETKLVSCIHVCSETGVVNNLKKIKDIMSEFAPKAALHSDGVQAFLKLNVNVEDLGVDFYTVSSHKVGGPKGVGALWVENKNKLKPQILGGGQEGGFRSGTENLPAIMGFCEVVKTRKPNVEYVKTLKQLFVENLTEEGIQVNFKNSFAYILSLTLKNVNGETIVNALKEKGIYVSRGSACSSKKAGNRIFEGMNYSLNDIKGLLRISFFETNTEDEVVFAAKTLNQVYKDIKQRTSR